MAGRNGKFAWTGQSTYGYTLYPRSRLFKSIVGSSIPAFGQLIIKHTGTFLKNKGYEIIGGDTDSVFFPAKNKKLLQILKEGYALVKEINASYKTFVKQFGADKSFLEIEFEKVFKKALYVCKKGNRLVGAKKNYAYTILWKDGKLGDDTIKTKGMSSRRSDTPKITKELQLKLIKMIFDGENKEKIISYIKSIEYKIKKGIIPIEELAFPKGIQKDLDQYGLSKFDSTSGKYRKSGIPPVVQGAKYSNKYLGTKFNKGDKPKWLYIKRTPQNLPPTKVLTFEDNLPKGFIPDYDLMITKIIRDKIGPILLSYNFDKIPDFDNNNLNNF